jgi:hypothetical protein
LYGQIQLYDFTGKFPDLDLSLPESLVKLISLVRPLFDSAGLLPEVAFQPVSEVGEAAGSSIG